MKIVKREVYLNKIRPFYNKQLIKILTGPRRCGKSFMLRQIHEEQQKKAPKANFIFVDKEKHEFKNINDDDNLMEYVKANEAPGMNYLFIDELQEIQHFEKALRSLLAEGNYDIYCTGSNSQMLSGEISTFLSGRQIEIRIHPLSFPEYLIFHQKEKSQASLNSYLKYGGLPYIMHLPDQEEVINDYLKNIMATILYRDVVQRYAIRDVTFLQDLLEFLSGNTGSVFSARRIAAYLKSQRQSKTVSVILNYLKYLENAYIIFNIKHW